MAITNIPSKETWGQGLMSGFMTMLSHTQRKEIADKEAALKKAYYKILGEEADRKGKVAPFIEREAEAKAHIAEIALEEDKRVQAVHTKFPLLREQKMQNEAKAIGNQKEMGMMRLMLQGQGQQISALNQQLSQNKFTHAQEKDRMNWLFNTFLNPEVADPIRKAIGDDEFEARKGRAMKELTGVDKRVTPVKQGFLEGALGKLIGDKSSTSMSFDEALTAWKEGRVDGQRFWSVWKDRLEEEGYFLSHDWILKNPTPDQLKKLQGTYNKKLDLSQEGAMDKVLKEKK